MSKGDLERCVHKSLDSYFADLDGSDPHDLYKMVITCIEKPLFEYIIARAGGKQLLAAKYLGMNRNTLRKKLQQHDLL